LRFGLGELTIAVRCLTFDSTMKTVRVKIDPQNPAALPVGRVDYQILDSTTESQLAEQQKIDDAEAMQQSVKVRAA
jgi:hypothetical protein